MDIVALYEKTIGAENWKFNKRQCLYLTTVENTATVEMYNKLNIYMIYSIFTSVYNCIHTAGNNIPTFFKTIQSKLSAVTLSLLQPLIENVYTIIVYYNAFSC